MSPQGTMHLFLLTLFCLYFLSLSCTPTYAQGPGSYTTRGQCIDHCHQYEDALYRQTLNVATKASTWCYYWYRECTCIDMDCGTFQIKCDFIGINSDDENCTVRESDPGACVLTPLLTQLLFC